MDPGLVLSLCDLTGNMVKPWVEAGYRAMIVDVQHPEGEHTVGNLTKVGADVRHWLPPKTDYAAVFAFPPCTHLSRAGTRWYKDKGIRGLIEGLELVERCRAICEWSEAVWMLENPVGTLQTYWRPPDYMFDPYEYAGYLDHKAEAYTKKTCLWTSEDFVMPAHKAIAPIYKDFLGQARGTPEDRSNQRSVTPLGFAKAVFEANGIVLDEIDWDDL